MLYVREQLSSLYIKELLEEFADYSASESVRSNSIQELLPRTTLVLAEPRCTLWLRICGCCGTLQCVIRDHERGSSLGSSRIGINSYRPRRLIHPINKFCRRMNHLLFYSPDSSVNKFRSRMNCPQVVEELVATSNRRLTPWQLHHC